MRRSVACVGVVVLVLIGVLSAAPAVAAAGGTATAQPSPVPTEPAPPTTAPPSGANGLLSSGPPAATPQATPTPNPTATVAAPAIPSSLQQPGPATPTGAATTATQVPASSTPRPATATATRPPNTPTTGATPTGQPTSTPTGTPTGTLGANPAIPELTNLVILENPGIGGNAMIARAAARHYGEQFRPDGVPWTGWCEMYIGNVMDEAGIAHPRFETALLDAVSGPVYRDRAPAGSLVFFDQRANPNGHVGIALGDGTMLSALGGGIVRSAYESWSSYLGWRPYGATAPQDATFVLTPLLFPVESVDFHDFEMPPWVEQPSWYAPPPYIAPHTALK